jgi:hypothetical protein
MLLVGDNPFHGISHLSQERARSRNYSNDSVADKTDIVVTAIKNGAEGFSFSVSDVTLRILKTLRERGEIEALKLYAIVPYAFEYVRIATQTGTPSLAKKVAKQIFFSGDIGAVFGGLGAVVSMNPTALMKTYIGYEISRIRSAAGKKADLASILLHEVVTDMGLALNFDWLFKSYISYLNGKGITPGFNTRNFPYLVKKFTEWNINLDQILVETQFNKVGFQMNPSREEYEKTLSNGPTPIVLAISVMAAGYLKPAEAVDYVASLGNLKGVVAGVSTEQQAKELFPLFRRRLA